MESEYIATYLESLNGVDPAGLPSDRRIKTSKIFDKPTFESIREQADIAKKKGYTKFGVYIESLDDKESFEKDLKEALNIDVNVYTNARLTEANASGSDDSSQPEEPASKGTINQKRAVYIVNPFSPMLFFEKDGNGFSRSMIGYCREVISWVNSHRGEFDHYYFIPFILQKGEGKQLPEFTWRNINNEFIKYVSSTKGNIPGADVLMQFFNLKVPHGVEISHAVNSVDALKKELLSGSTIVATMDYPVTQSAVNKGKFRAKLCNYTFNYMNADPSNRIISIINEYNQMNVSDGKDNDKNASKPTLFEYYLRYIIGNRETSDVKGSIKASLAGKAYEYDLTKNATIGQQDRYYKHSRTDRASGSINYWFDDEGVMNFLKASHERAKSGDAQMAKSMDNIAYLLNQKGKDGKRRVDASVEKLYNLGHAPKDILGIRDDEERYDASKWDSDQYHMEFKGVAGKELFDIQKEINQNVDEMVDIQNEINELYEDDPNYEKTMKKLTARLDELEDENEELRAKISDDAANTLASKKIRNAKAGVKEKEKEIHDANVDLTSIRNTKSYVDMKTYFCIG